MGKPDDVQTITATAEIKPLINSAKLLWYVKERWPKEFDKTRHVLFFPQYFGYRLTGKAASDITYTGCHSYLWDFGKGDWSAVTDKLGIRAMLPRKPGLPENKLGSITREVAATTGLDPDTLVTLGVHDSNSSLIPYMISQKQDFVLNSTGTWCVAMHPAPKVHFSPDELGKMVFYNLSYKASPVKTSILLGGLEYEVYTSALMGHHKRSDWPDYNPSVYQRILAEPASFILPTVVPGTGQFPDSVARVVDGDQVYPVDDIRSGRRWPKAFDDYLAGFALANLSLAIQTRIALQRVGLKPGTEVFIEGGFRQNPNYRALLGALLPENPLFLTALEEATSFGAALCGKALVDGVPVDSLKGYVVLDKIPVEPARLDGLENYVEAFLKHLGA
jgi:sugar (pentulose or hexulose) kinase